MAIRTTIHTMIGTRIAPTPITTAMASFMWRPRAPRRRGLRWRSGQHDHTCGMRGRYPRAFALRGCLPTAQERGLPRQFSAIEVRIVRRSWLAPLPNRRELQAATIHVLELSCIKISSTKKGLFTGRPCRPQRPAARRRPFNKPFPVFPNCMHATALDPEMRAGCGKGRLLFSGCAFAKLRLDETDDHDIACPSRTPTACGAFESNLARRPHTRKIRRRARIDRKCKKF